MRVESLDNISDEVLDYLRDTYQHKKGFRVNDDRKGKLGREDRNYFLINNDGRSLKDTDGVEYTFIWIDNNLWQYRFVNVYVSSKGLWKSPLQVLNELLK